MEKPADFQGLCANWSALDESTQNLLRPLIDAGVLVTYPSDEAQRVQLTFAGKAVPALSDPLRNYLHIRAEFLSWRQRLNARASLWEFGGRPAELLLNEEDSRTALRWKADSADELSATEIAYIDESARSQHGLGRATVPWNVAAAKSGPAVGASVSAGQGTSSTGEFTRIFQSATTTVPAQPGLTQAPSQSQAPSQADEFTRMFQDPQSSPPPNQSAASPPELPPLPAPAAQSPPADHTRMFQSPAAIALPAPAPAAKDETPARPAVLPRGSSPWLSWKIWAVVGILAMVLVGTFFLTFMRSAPAVRSSPTAEARAAMQAGRYADAVSLYDKAIADGQSLYTERAYARRLKGDLEGAISDYRQAITSGARDEQTFSDLAYVFALRGDYESAIKYLTEGIHQSPSTSKLYVDRGSAYPATKQPEAALSDYEAALRSDRTSAAAQAGRIAALTRLKLPVGKADVPPRVYIHISSEVQRYPAKVIQDFLKDAGYEVPGIQFMSSSATIPSQNEVRYVFPEDRAQAERLAQDLQTGTVGLNVTVVRVKVYQQVSPRHFELWFAAPGSDEPVNPRQQNNMVPNQVYRR